jgi:hypothetical protein
MFNLYKFYSLVLIFSLNISADYAYEVKGCNEFQEFFDFLFAETTEEIIKNSDKSTLYLECWGKNIVN